MKKALIVIVGLVAVVTISAIIYSSGRNKTIVIAQAGDFFLYAPLYVAKDAGIFEKQGLDVKIITTGGDDKTWTAILAKSADFGVADPTFTAISEQQGRGGIVVASIVNGVPFWGISYKTLQAQEPLLRNRSVVTFPAPSTAYVLQKQMFAKQGLQPNIVEAAFGAIIPALKAGRGDIGLELEPNVSLAAKDGATVVYSLADVYGDFAITGLTTSPEKVRDQPEQVEAIVRTISAALLFIREKPADTLAILKQRFPDVPPDVAESALKRVIDANILPKTPVMSEASWNKAVALRVEAGDLKQVKPFSTYVNNSFAEKIAP